MSAVPDVVTVVSVFAVREVVLVSIVLVVTAVSVAPVVVVLPAAVDVEFSAVGLLVAANKRVIEGADVLRDSVEDLIVVFDAAAADRRSK